VRVVQQWQEKSRETKNDKVLLVVLAWLRLDWNGSIMVWGDDREVGAS